MKRKEMDDRYRPGTCDHLYALNLHTDEENRGDAGSRDNAAITGTVKVTIPFAFSVAGKTFEAGTYYIGPADEGNEMAIKSASGKTALLALTNMVSIANQVVPPKLVFHKYGDQYFLTQAWLKYSDEGREFFVTPRGVADGARVQPGKGCAGIALETWGRARFSSLSPRYIGQLKPGKT